MSDLLRAVLPGCSVPCPTCGSPVGKKCRALTSGRSTDTHVARWDVAYPPPAAYTPSGLDEFHPDTTHNPNPEVP